MANDALEGPDPAADGCQLPATQAMPVVPRAAEPEPAAAAAAAPREAGDAPPDATAAAAAAAAAAADDDAAARAIAATGRYRIDELLGEGGMGRVFRAHDNRLRRTVAIKVLTAFDAAASARLAREARLQARVEHPNVAKVYETGETQGVRYIVMQFIPGRPLGEVAAAMSLEQKVRVAQRVAEGLHEAHRLGLVHGDVKPGNVLVVGEADGAAHPYVLDFGIARELAAPGATLTSVIAGTPPYMAPEQARGEALDRRTDVYALGVTLYRLLSGKLPFPDMGSIETLTHVLADDPPPLRQAAPQVAADLEAIVMKCLEKLPGRRYPTARALADDLVRFLDGEPVLARRQTLLYRLAKKARKNRALVGVSAAALLAVLIATGWAVRERLQTARRAALAQRFGREEERFEWALRAAHELPLHDTSPERGAVRAAIERLEREVQGLPAALRAPGDAAIGRGYLALGDEELARRHLERAWQAGYHAPELAYTLGLSLVHAYQEALARARLARDDAERRLALDDANRRLRDPALDYLRSSRAGDLVASEYLEALLAFLAGDSAVTRQKTAAAIARLPWLYEALALEGQSWRATADRAHDETERGAAMGHAAAALERAVRLGGSDARNYLGLCETESERLQTAISGPGVGVQALGDRAVGACDAALRSEPRNAPALVRKAEALALLAGFELDHGADPEPRLREAEAAARAAVRLRGGLAEPYRALAGVFSLRGRALRMHGGDVRQALKPAIGNLEQALALEPNDWQSLAVLGGALGQRGMQESEHGEDATASFAGSAAALRRAAALEPRLYTTYYYLGRTYGDWGEYLTARGKDATAVQERAVAAYRQAIAIKPDYAQAYNSLGAVYSFRGSQPRRGADPLALLVSAAAALQRAIEIQPSYANPHFNLGQVYREMGHLDDLNGRDPWPHLHSAIAAFQDGLRLNPNIFFAYTEMGRIYLYGGEYDVSHHRSPADAMREAVRLVDKGLAMQPEDYMALKIRGEARLRLASWALEQHASPDAALASALADFERATRANAKDFGVYELFGQASLLAAKGRLAAGRPPDPLIDQGLRQVARGREVAGEDQSGLLEVEGRLHLLRAQATRDAQPRAAAARQAVAAFTAAVRLLPSLRSEAAPPPAAARRLAGEPDGPGRGN
jgi:predicted Ser/Thr protein kinase